MQGVEKSFDGEFILTSVNLRLEWNQKLGLVGRNGSGKTTLLRMLTGQQEPDKGSIQYSKGVRAGYLKQEDAVDASRTVLQEAEAAFQHVIDMERRIREVEHEMAAVSSHPEDLAKVMEEYSMLHDRFDAMGGFDNLRDIPGVLKRLGFGPNDLSKPCGRLSGGEKTRLAIARLLLSGPDILFLDEPTNHLDIEATEWLEGFLRDFGGGLVLVSHDRTFLDRVVTSIAEVERTKLTMYPGNYSAFCVQKEANRARTLETHEREQKEIARMMEFFEKWKNTPSKRNQAQERFRWAQRIKKNATDKPPPPGKKAKLNIRPTQLSGNEVVVLDGVGMQYGPRVLFDNVTALFRRGERIGVVGPNGAGKSTLIKIILERETPTSGMARLGASVTIGYFAQDTSDLDLEATVLDNMMDVAEMEPTQARTHLGRFLFSGDDVFRPAKFLSGGEKNKLVLAQLTFLRPNLLILDEPTNHLDIDSREALGQMLREYEGTLLLVSHDRYLLNQVTNYTLEVEAGRVILYDVPYNEYRQKKSLGLLKADENTRKSQIQRNSPQANMFNSGNTLLLDDLLQQRPDAHKPPAASNGLNAFQLSKERQKAKAMVASAEKSVEELECRLSAIEASLSSPAPTDNVIALSQEHGGVQAALAEAMDRWEKAEVYMHSLG